MGRRKSRPGKNDQVSKIPFLPGQLFLLFVG